MKTMTPELLAMKHHFLAPLAVLAVYADPQLQARYNAARAELAGKG